MCISFGSPQPRGVLHLLSSVPPVFISLFIWCRWYGGFQFFIFLPFPPSFSNRLLLLFSGVGYLSLHFFLPLPVLHSLYSLPTFPFLTCCLIPPPSPTHSPHNCQYNSHTTSSSPVQKPSVSFQSLLHLE